MQNPINRQEFLRQQERAIAAARDAQRRATLPHPPRNTETPKPMPRNPKPDPEIPKPKPPRPQEPKFDPPRQSMPDLASLLGAFAAPQKPPRGAAPGPSVGKMFDSINQSAPTEEGIDSLMLMMVMLMLKQENADQGLLLALMYIMM
ncbi:MAG: hypothetical protein LBB67_07440 [Oscillospiraceae bacterium]|nr:hypothetical protein [Oscillospiraceae bacterium]